MGFTCLLEGFTYFQRYYERHDFMKWYCYTMSDAQQYTVWAVFTSSDVWLTDQWTNIEQWKCYHPWSSKQSLCFPTNIFIDLLRSPYTPESLTCLLVVCANRLETLEKFYDYWYNLLRLSGMTCHTQHHNNAHNHSNCSNQWSDVMFNVKCASCHIIPCKCIAFTTFITWNQS